MKNFFSVLYFLLLFVVCSSSPGAEPASGEKKCPPGTGQVQDSSGICADPGETHPLFDQPGTVILQSSLEPRRNAPAAGEKKAQHSPARTGSETGKITVYFFWGKGCPHCEQEKTFLSDLKRANPALEVKDYEVWYHKQHAGLLSAMLNAYGMKPSGVPVTFIDDRVFEGFSRQSREAIEAAIAACREKPCLDPAEALEQIPRGAGAAVSAAGRDAGPSVDIPMLGPLDARKTSLPVLTLVIAGLDSFNPCAFFVLLSLLGLLVHARSRNRMLLIGGVFVFFSGFVYFLFMAAWLNLFLVLGHVTVITSVAGGVSIVIAAINIKDFFLFKKGVSLTISDSAKPRLFDRMRKLMRSTSVFSVLIGTTVLAVVANSYELLCTAGFPMVFTRILTLNNLTTTSYYLYLAAYNIVYVVPLFVIVLAFTITLGSRKLTERQGRFLKLVSGAMMLGLGGVLIVNPALLNSTMISFAILAGAIGVSLIAAMVTWRLGY